MDKKTTVGSQRIRSLFDAGSFVEIGAFVKGSVDAEEYDGVICGYGSVDGKLAFAFVQDMDRMHGALDAPGAKKIGMLYEMAMKNGAPVIGVLDSAGAVVYDGSAALSAYGNWLKCVSDASGVIPQIALIGGVCTGLATVAASMFDFVLTVKDKSQIYVNAAAEKSGNRIASVVYDTENDAVAGARSLIGLLPQNNREKSSVEAEDVNRLLTDTPDLPGDVLDGGKFFELYADYGKEIKVGFGRVGGELVGVLTAKGTLTADAARKASWLYEFCDSFGITVLTLVDSDGFGEVSADDINAFGRLTAVVAASDCPKITVVVGHACGAAYTLLASRALGADLAFALPGSAISTLAPEKAVAFVWNDKVTSEKTRADVEKEWIDTYASPETAAARGDIDDVIPAEELRMRLCSAVYMLSAKADGKPSRRHPTLPL